MVPHIDWQLCITRVRNRMKLSAQKLGDLVGTSHTTICSIENQRGREPSFSTGLLLLDLHHDCATEQEHAALMGGPER